MLLKPIWAAGVAAFVAAVSLVVVAAIATGQSAAGSDPRRAFRRPANLVDDGRAEKDPVWRLGRRLFFDASLSGSKLTSCASCHRADKGWSDGRPLAINDAGSRMLFKAPTLLNIGSLERLGWTGRFSDIAAVSLFAINSVATMNMPLRALGANLQADASYRRDIREAFGRDDILVEDVGTALTRYVASLTSVRSPFDAWIEGDDAAIGPEARRGFDVFVGKARCTACHSGWSLSDGSFHDIGTSEIDPGRGRYFASSVKLQHAFKTPSLRNIAQRAPYMHDGSKPTLDDVIDLYDKGGIARASRAEEVRPASPQRFGEGGSQGVPADAFGGNGLHPTRP